MKLIKIFLLIIIALQLNSCGITETEKATVKLQLAESLYQQGDTAQALQQADSIRILYATATQEIATADQFKKKIYSEILFRKQDELDSTNQSIVLLDKNFIQEKTELDRYTQYVHKRQDAKRRWNKSYIQVHLDERGELYISSNYYGSTWLDHTGIRVYSGDLQAKTDSVGLGSALNHHSDFLEIRWEKVTYADGKDNGVIQFIADHIDLNLKAVFLGKNYYYIILEEYDKQAIKDALQLSKLLKRRLTLEAEIKSLQSKVG